MSQTNHDQDGLTTLFKVIIPGMKEAVFQTCDGMEAEVEVNFFYSGGSLKAPKTARGNQRVNRISFSQGTSGKDSNSKTIFDWFLDVLDSGKPLQKKTLSILITNSNNDVLSEWRVVNAWPCRWVAPVLSRDNASQTLEFVSFAHEGLERKK